MANYKIISYRKKEQSWLSRINSMDDITGVILEPYEITLEKSFFLNLFKTIVIKDFYFPCNFNHEKELITGRVFIFKDK